MAIMYLNGSPIPYSVHDDIYLNPVMASNELLTNFPPTFFLTGEKDPLVDDTVVFAARLRMAKMRRAKRMQGGYGTRRSTSMGQYSQRSIDISDVEDEDEDFGIRVRILEGMSHAFFNMMAFLPEASHATTLTARWFNDMFEMSDKEASSLSKSGNIDSKGSSPEKNYTEKCFETNLSNQVTSADLPASKPAAEQSAGIKLDKQLSIVSEQKLMQRRRNDLSSLHLT